MEILLDDLSRHVNTGGLRSVDTATQYSDVTTYQYDPLQKPRTFPWYFGRIEGYLQEIRSNLCTTIDNPYGLEILEVPSNHALLVANPQVDGLFTGNLCCASSIAFRMSDPRNMRRLVVAHFINDKIGAVLNNLVTIMEKKGVIKDVIIDTPDSFVDEVRQEIGVLQMSRNHFPRYDASIRLIERQKGERHGVYIDRVEAVVLTECRRSGASSTSPMRYDISQRIAWTPDHLTSPSVVEGSYSRQLA